MSTVTLKGANGTYIFDPSDESGLLYEGSQGRVFEGFDLSNNQRVAIKVLYRQLTDEPRNIERARREASIRIVDENLLEMKDFVVDEKRLIYHIVSEYLEGNTLEQHLDARNTALHPEEALSIIRPVLAGLKRLHRQQPKLIHRGIDPSNVMLCKDGRVKLMDYGMVKLASSEVTRLTTPGDFAKESRYMAPEVIKDAFDANDESVDVYGAGLLLLTMLLGKMPFAAQNEQQLVAAKESFSFQPMGHLPDHVNWALQKALFANPMNRHRTINEFWEALFPPLQTEPEPEPQPVLEQPMEDDNMASAYLLGIKIMIVIGAIGAILFIIALIFT